MFIQKSNYTLSLSVSDVTKLYTTRFSLSIFGVSNATIIPRAIEFTPHNTFRNRFNIIYIYWGAIQLLCRVYTFIYRVLSYVCVCVVHI